jgi:hypothetical protein
MFQKKNQKSAQNSNAEANHREAVLYHESLEIP